MQSNPGNNFNFTFQPNSNDHIDTETLADDNDDVSASVCVCMAALESFEIFWKFYFSGISTIPFGFHFFITICETKPWMAGYSG